jgi:hypothetical protein
MPLSLIHPLIRFRKYEELRPLDGWPLLSCPLSRPDSIGSLRALNQALDFNQDLVEGARRFLRFGSTPRLDQAAGTKLNHQSHKNNGAPRRGFYTTQGLPRS